MLDPNKFGYQRSQGNLCLWVLREEKQSKWFLDSGCSRHMTGDPTIFATLSKQKGGHVTFGDNSQGKIINIGNIGGNPSLLIENVFLVDKLKIQSIKY